MARAVRVDAAPFPRAWPRRVRSAVVHAISLAQASLTIARGRASESARVHSRLTVETERLRQELALLREELGIKDARMLQIPAQRRPHYPPVERLAILELRAARGWSLSQTARRFLVTPATVCSWMHRLDDDGPNPLLQPCQAGQ